MFGSRSLLLRAATIGVQNFKPLPRQEDRYNAIRARADKRLELAEAYVNGDIPSFDDIRCLLISRLGEDEPSSRPRKAVRQTATVAARRLRMGAIGADASAAAEPSRSDAAGGAARKRPRDPDVQDASAGLASKRLAVRSPEKVSRQPKRRCVQQLTRSRALRVLRAFAHSQCRLGASPPRGQSARSGRPPKAQTTCGFCGVIGHARTSQQCELGRFFARQGSRLTEDNEAAALATVQVM